MKRKEKHTKFLARLKMKSAAIYAFTDSPINCDLPSCRHQRYVGPIAKRQSKCFSFIRHLV
jgi:hypothetical protein